MARTPRVVPQQSDGIQRRSYQQSYRKTGNLGLKALGDHRQRDVSAPKADTRNYAKRGKGVREDQDPFNVDFGNTGFIDRNIKD
jgi:hypothetical protein